MKKTKTGLLALGYVENIVACVEEFNAVQGINLPPLDLYTLNEMVENVNKEYLNQAGYPQSKDGVPVTFKTAKYIRFRLPIVTEAGRTIYGWFKKHKESGLFKGPNWGTLQDFNKCLLLDRNFSIGRMYFDSPKEGLAFLDEIAKHTIPERWEYSRHRSQINHPVLKSYLENILNKLIKEHKEGKPNRLVFSRDGSEVMFNSNLLTTLFQDALIIGKVEKLSNGNIILHNPYLAKSSISNRFDLDKKPEPPQFYEDINDVVFQTSWIIEKDYETFGHIINERRDRFPEKWANCSPLSLARKLDNAINLAVILAKRNHRIMAPMYRPQDGKIQLMMPIYLGEEYVNQPDFALVLTPDKEHHLYKPETILPLDAAYQNARLIAKPDESWLNPNKI